jgi:proteasome assembly chaperone (PAC2) family protein
MALYELIERPELDEPMLVLALEGWIDAGLAAASAAELLCDQLDTVTVARFSTDDLLDYRARRPVAHLTDGVLRGLTWPEIELRAATDGAGNEMLLLVGAEPDRLWHRFTDEVVTLSLDFGARMCVGLGAYPFAAPHTRSPRVACTASTPSLAEGTFLRASLDFPGGIQAAIEQGCDERGIPAVGLWAQIPHYVPANMPFPAGSVALVEGLSLLGNLSLPRPPATASTS